MKLMHNSDFIFTQKMIHYPLIKIYPLTFPDTCSSYWSILTISGMISRTFSPFSTWQWLTDGTQMSIALWKSCTTWPKGTMGTKESRQTVQTRGLVCGKLWYQIQERTVCEGTSEIHWCGYLWQMWPLKMSWQSERLWPSDEQAMLWYVGTELQILLIIWEYFLQRLYHWKTFQHFTIAGNWEKCYIDVE